VRNERRRRQGEKIERSEEQKKAEQDTRRGVGAVQDPAREPVQDPDERLAAAVGISVEKYRRKAARGEIKFDHEGKPTVISKQEIKKQKKTEAKANGGSEEIKSKKRKLEDDGQKTEKRKKKKSED